MLGDWYYYDNEIGFYKIDTSVIKAAMGGTLAIIRYKKLYFAKWVNNDVAELWDNGKWSNAFVNEIKDKDGKLLHQATVLKVDNQKNVSILPTKTTFHGLCKPLPKFPVSSIEEVNAVMGTFKECIVANPDSNSRIFEDMYHFLYDHIHLLREDPALLLLTNQSIRSVVHRPACRPLIHYWCYKIGHILDGLQEGSFDWFQIPTLKTFVVRTPKFASPKKEPVPEQKQKKAPCPEGQVLDKTTKECRERKKPVRQTNTKKARRTPCPKGQTRNRKTNLCERKQSD